MTRIAVTYGSQSHDLCRLVDDPADETVATLVREVRQLSDDERAAVRSQLGERDCYTLITFARRRSASAIRDGDLDHALDPIGALTLITITKIDYRDFSADLRLYAVGRLGGDVTATISAAMRLSEPQVKASFAARQDVQSSAPVQDPARGRWEDPMIPGTSTGSPSGGLGTTRQSRDTVSSISLGESYLFLWPTAQTIDSATSIRNF
jgi:hypothetical protein